MGARSRRSGWAAARGGGHHELRLVVPVALADEVVGILAREARGAAVDHLDDRTTAIRIYFDRQETARRARDGARAVLEHLGLAFPAAAAPVLSRVADEPWVERFQAALEPFDLGSGFRVFPKGGPGGTVRRGRRIPIRLAPSRAFGTGQHATTALCAELVEERVARGSAWLDLGCGTAVLAVIAAHRGAGEVRALDTDPEAVEVARRVVANNALTGRIRVEAGSIENAGDRDWDGVVSNIELAFLLKEAAALARLLTARGQLIVSGFLDRDLPAVVREFARAGLVAAQPSSRGDWAALALTRNEEG